MFNQLIPILKVVTYISLLLIIVVATISNLTAIRYYITILSRQTKYTTVSYAKRNKERFEREKRMLYRKRKGLVYNLNLKISRAGLIDWLNAQLLIAISLLLFAISTIVLFNSLQNIVVSVFSSVFFLVLPYMVITFLVQLNVARIEKHILYYLETLRNFVAVDKKDILTAYKLSKDLVKPKILKKHVEHFLFEMIEANREQEEAIETHKQAVNIRAYSDFLDNVKVCLKYGGDYAYILDRTTERLSILQKTKIKRISRANSIRLVLLALILFNISFLINNYFKNYDYFLMVVNNKVIISIMFVNMYIVLFMAYRAGRMDL